MKPINITGMVIMCREICKQAIGFVFCYTNTSVSFYQGLRKKNSLNVAANVQLSEKHHLIDKRGDGDDLT